MDLSYIKILKLFTYKVTTSNVHIDLYNIF